MADYTWRPNGVTVNIQARSLDPFLAFKEFVLPALDSPEWVENSRKLTDTDMSSREWAGLVIHALALMDLTGDTFQVAREYSGGDGAITRTMHGRTLAVLVEQTLATHREHHDLLETVERRVQAKSNRGPNYSENKHLVVLCNINGQLEEGVLAKIVSESAFNIVNFIGFQENGLGRHYLSFLFDKEVPGDPINRCAIDERKLRLIAQQTFPADGKPFRS
jgi:hypothetical protein